MMQREIGMDKKKVKAIQYWSEKWDESCKNPSSRDWYVAGYWNGLIGQHYQGQKPEWEMGFCDAQGDWSDR